MSENPFQYIGIIKSQKSVVLKVKVPRGPLDRKGSKWTLMGLFGSICTLSESWRGGPFEKLCLKRFSMTRIILAHVTRPPTLLRLDESVDTKSHT